MQTFLAILCKISPSRTMPSKLVAATSALTGPETTEQISAINSLKFRPDLAIKLGFVVTPSSKP